MDEINERKRCEYVVCLRAECIKLARQKTKCIIHLYLQALIKSSGEKYAQVPPFQKKEKEIKNCDQKLVIMLYGVNDCKIFVCEFFRTN